MKSVHNIHGVHPCPSKKTAKTILKGILQLKLLSVEGLFGSLIPSNKAVLYIPKWCLYRDD